MWLAGGGCGWNWVWLGGVVVSRDMDFLTLLIPTLLVYIYFLQQHPYFLFIFKMFFVLYLYIPKVYNYIYIYPNDIIESVDSISRDKRDAPLTQYITNAGITHARHTITHFKHHNRI